MGCPSLERGRVIFVCVFRTSVSLDLAKSRAAVLLTRSTPYGGRLGGHWKRSLIARNPLLFLHCVSYLD